MGDLTKKDFQQLRSALQKFNIRTKFDLAPALIAHPNMETFKEKDGSPFDFYTVGTENGEPAFIFGAQGAGQTDVYYAFNTMQRQGIIKVTQKMLQYKHKEAADSGSDWGGSWSSPETVTTQHQAGYVVTIPQSQLAAFLAAAETYEQGLLAKKTRRDKPPVGWTTGVVPYNTVQADALGEAEFALSHAPTPEAAEQVNELIGTLTDTLEKESDVLARADFRADRAAFRARHQDATRGPLDHATRVPTRRTRD